MISTKGNACCKSQDTGVKQVPMEPSLAVHSEFGKLTTENNPNLDFTSEIVVDNMKIKLTSKVKL